MVPGIPNRHGTYWSQCSGAKVLGGEINKDFKVAQKSFVFRAGERVRDRDKSYKALLSAHIVNLIVRECDQHVGRPAFLIDAIFA